MAILQRRPVIQIRLFGRAQLSDGDVALKFKAPPRALSLLSYLLLHKDAVSSRDAVAFAIWPDDTEGDARANLRRHLYYLLNDTLPAADGALPWIVADKRTVQWNAGAPAWCDVSAFLEYSGSPATAADAVALYKGDLLEGFEDEWLQAPRDRLREQQVGLLLDLISAHRARGECAEGIAYAKQLLTIDPWREDAIRSLIVLRHASGDRAGALSTYREFAKRLEEEMGVAPMPETTAEYERVASADEPQNIQEPAVGANRSRFVWKSIYNTEAVTATPSFTGREDELTAIDSALWNEGKVAAVHGLGGIGKSAVAREYARRNRERYSVIWLLGAESEAAIIDGLLKLGLQIVPELASANDRRAAAAYVAANAPEEFLKPALLIFDNLEDERLLRQWAPHGAHVIATSRNAAWSGDVSAIRIDTWNLDETVNYLQHEIQRADVNAASAQDIAQKLGCLPLALAHAAAYLKATPNVTIQRYLDRLTDHLSTTPRGAEYDRAVLATFCEAVIKAEEDAPGAAALLVLASYFAPEGISEELFWQPADVYADDLAPEPEDHSALDLRSVASNAMRADEALGTLHRLSLMTFVPDSRTYTMHRLVRQAARQLAGSHERPWIESAIAAIEAVFPTVEFANWRACERLLPHARVALAALNSDSGFVPAARLANRCGSYLAKRAAFPEAEQFLRRALAIVERCKECEPDAELAANLNTLAALLRDTNRHAEAEPLHRRALEIYEKTLGPSDPHVATVLNDLGILLHYTYRLMEAETAFRRALDIDESAYGPTHPLVALRLHNLAVLLHERNRLAEAEPLFRRALSIDVETRGPNDPDVATDVCNLGWLLFASGDVSQAEPLLRRSVDIREGAFGTDHPAYAFALNDLAVLLHDTGRTEEAEPLYRSALEICESRFGPQHPIVAAHLNSLAEVLHDTGHLQETEVLYRRALAIDETSYGREHPNVARDLNNLAGLLLRTERNEEAGALMERALSIVSACYASDHPRMTTVRENYALLDEGAGENRPRGETKQWRNIRRSPSRGLRQ